MHFDDMPTKEKEHLIRYFGLSEREERLMLLKYVDGHDYYGIAGEMNMSPKSVSSALNRARKHMVEIAKQLYPIADERTRYLIDSLGWVELEWPVLTNRRRA